MVEKKKEEKTLYSMLEKKLEKVIKIVDQQEEIETEYLNSGERIQIAKQINQAIAKLTKLQAKMLNTD